MIKIKVCPNNYPLLFSFFFGEWDVDEATKWVIKYHGLPRDAHLTSPPADGCCFQFDHSSLIWISEVPHDTLGLGILTHEVLHAVFNSGRDLGFGYDEASDEFYTYLAQFLVTESLNKSVALENKLKAKEEEEIQLALEKPKKNKKKK